MCFPHPEPQIATKTRVLGISTSPNGPWALGAKNCHGSNQKCSPGTLFGGPIFLENLPLYTNPVHTKTQTPYTHTRKHTHRFASVRIHTYTHTRKHTHRFASVRIHTYTHTHKHTKIRPSPFIRNSIDACLIDDDDDQYR